MIQGSGSILLRMVLVLVLSSWGVFAHEPHVASVKRATKITGPPEKMGTWETVQTSPTHPLHQCGINPTLFRTGVGVQRYAVCTSSKSHNCCAGKGNRT